MEPQSIPEVVAGFLAQPGIDVTRLKPNTTVIVETTQGIFELTVTQPRHNLVRVFGTDSRLRSGITGQLFVSHYDIEGRVSVPHWIGKTLRMQFTFKNGIYSCSPALSARVEGDGWHYDVF